MAVSEQISDGLWDEFHTVVNMTSRELQEWLNVESAGEETEEVPDRAGKPMGRRVLEILGKRRTDLTQDDVSVMQRVCDIVRSQRDPSLDPKAGGTDWRHGLMDIGHDPLKPT
ncbi:hypothetical protein AMK26_19020 [Streptomyces sp. CB03234]|uniref:DUF3140 domain-containing protein n=1 Tax=Streptomyces sp. (strain CB03234) TaxID=1703937 RepID=UPI0009397774|nr:DUF3140 domain-containing protein [Streptomyces sp. CB03234]OKK03908.1 hypothetical protein AMK26_19020 [Streptomyces sp. CB03234]